MTCNGSCCFLPSDMTRLTFTSLFFHGCERMFIFNMHFLFFFFLSFAIDVRSLWALDILSTNAQHLKRADWVSLIGDFILIFWTYSMEAEMLGWRPHLCPSKSMKKADAWFTAPPSSRAEGWRLAAYQRLLAHLILTHIMYAFRKGLGNTPCVRGKGFRHRKCLVKKVYGVIILLPQ